MTFIIELVGAKVDSFSKGAHVELLGQHLVVHELPEIFTQRYGTIPKKIFVRECYEDLYRIVSGLMLKGSCEYGVCLFTGVPGIGKSLFLVYFIYRFQLDYRFLDKRFALEFRSGTYTVFMPTTESGNFVCSVIPSMTMMRKDLLLLCDINDATEPSFRAKWTLIFSSPAPGRYKEVIKNAPSFKYIMPTWSAEELMFLVEDNVDSYERFAHFGGVPRHLLSSDVRINSYTTLTKALDDKGGDIINGFFNFSFGIIDSLESYILVHINPPQSGDGGYSYDGATVYSFASDEIFQLLVAKYEVKMLAGATNIFNAGAASNTYGAVSAGNLFEKICLWLKPLSGQGITGISMSGGDDVTFDVPSDRHILSHDWKRTAQLCVNKFILPRISNLESGDAFCVVQRGPNCFLLVVFQVTVGNSHPVKVNGLHEILMAYPEIIRKKITQKALVFVIPKHGTLDRDQKLQTQKGKEAVRLPTIVEGFKQYVYRHKI